MSRSISSNIMRNFSSKMANKKSALPVQIQRSFPLNKELAKVIIAVPEAIQHRLSEAEIASTFAEMDLRYLPNSLVRCHESNRNLFSVMTSTKREVLTAETAAASNLVEVASNVFTDDQDNVWTKVEDNGKTLFVCTASDDIESILSAHQSTNIHTASIEVAAAEGFNPGDAVVFYNLASETATFGVAADANSVYVPTADRIVEVASTVVLASAPGVAGHGDKGDIIEYMRKLYGHNAEFFNKLRGLIESNLSV